MNYLIKELVDTSSSYEVSVAVLIIVGILIILSIIVLTIIKKLKD